MVDSTYFGQKTYRKQDGNFIVASGGKIVVEAGGRIEDAGGNQINGFQLDVDIADLSAEADYYVVAPFTGKLVKMLSVIDGAVGTADATITASIAGVDVTNGVLTIATAASAAGDVDIAAPTALNTIAGNTAMRLRVTGGGAGGTPRAHVTLLFERI